ncbi:MAG: hypothetical protein ABW168_08105 [Sedimenticola sp.]
MGYQLAHNYEHGEKHLAFNCYQLTLLAFTLHQISELCDIAFKACRKKAGSKRSLWEKFRTFVNAFVFENMEQLLRYYLNYDGYNIIPALSWSVPLLNPHRLGRRSEPHYFKIQTMMRGD